MLLVAEQVNALMVGLPSVDLRYPKTLVAWIKLRGFVASSFEAAGMVAVDMGFLSIVGLILLLQVRISGRTEVNEL